MKNNNIVVMKKRLEDLEDRINIAYSKLIDNIMKRKK